MDCDSTDALLHALRDSNRIVAARAAQLLGELELPEAIAPLIDYVTTSRHYCKTAGFAALAAIGDRGVCEAIRPLVDAPNVEDDWYWMAVALLALGDDAGAGYLAELADADEDVFFAWFAPAILALDDEPAPAAELKVRVTVETCCAGGVRNVRQTDPGVLVWVTEVLGLLAGDAACEKLRELLDHRSRYVRGRAALSLLAADACDANVGAVSDRLEEDPTDYVRIQAALALSLAGRPQADTLAAAVESAADPFDQAKAVEALGLLGSADHAGLIAEELTCEDPYVRRCAVEATGRLDPPRARPLCDDPDALVRLQAAKVMAEGGAA